MADRLYFPRTFRLHESYDFKRIFSTPQKRLHSAHFCALICSNTLSHPRLGLAISKKFTKKTHDRNRIKRQIREFFRCHQQEFPAFDMVFVSKKGVTDACNASIRKELSELLHKIQHTK